MRLPRLASVAAGAALLAALAVRAGTAATPTQTFVYATPTQVMVGWDPATSYSNEIIAMSNVYETLTHYDPVTKRAKPALATRFS